MVAFFGVYLLFALILGGMKHWLFIGLMALSAVDVAAQEDFRSSVTEIGLGNPIQEPDVSKVVYAPDSLQPAAEGLRSEWTFLPDQYDTWASAYLPWGGYAWGWAPWRLHEGLNVSLSASLITSLGKNSYRGVGFGQQLSAMYLTPLTKDNRLSLTVGGYFNNLSWGHRNMRDAGLSAILDYRINDHWEAFLYGQKSLVSDKHIPRPLYDMGAVGDRIGAGVIYHVNPSFSVEVSFEHAAFPQRDSFHDTYMRMSPPTR